MPETNNYTTSRETNSSNRNNLYDKIKKGFKKAIFTGLTFLALSSPIYATNTTSNAEQIKSQEQIEQLTNRGGELEEILSKYEEGDIVGMLSDPKLGFFCVLDEKSVKLQGVKYYIDIVDNHLINYVTIYGMNNEDKLLPIETFNLEIDSYKKIDKYYTEIKLKVNEEFKESTNLVFLDEENKITLGFVNSNKGWAFIDDSKKMYQHDWNEICIFEEPKTYGKVVSSDSGKKSIEIKKR